MLVLTVNGGSTSVKLAAYRSADGADTARCAEAPVRTAAEHLTGSPDPREALRAFLRKLEPSVTAVGHRIVHGGRRFVAPVRIDADVEAALGELSELAPLHNPLALAWVAAAREACGPQVPQIAVFDTAFFASLPRVAAEYALPASAGVALGVRRYGFHGIAHQALWRRWCELNPERDRGGRIITLQLGGGCSMAAIARGQPIDTTMGFSPLEGLVMATRSGDVDPAAVAYLEHKLGVSGDRVIEIMNHESGLLGVSCLSGDMRALLVEPNEAAQLAVELFCYRVRKTLGAYFAALGGCDGIVFGGGVGEHLPEIRARILTPLAWAGVELDAAANEAARGAEACISRPQSTIKVQVVPVDEERALATAALAVVRQSR
ncbi:MAG TPA: acetate/propionate family kinase [Steroidobacteraceae bacterium]|nr:acetate/propionate family kinase [Steroidobacteraceae bacterium]